MSLLWLNMAVTLGSSIKKRILNTQYVVTGFP